MGPLITLLTGHRGAGKTTYLKSVREFAKRHRLEIETLDLDEEIARRYKKDDVGEIFKEAGEQKFRALEQAMLAKLVNAATRPAVIALGAGYEGGIPQPSRVIWIRRLTDAGGRSFLNRPRLNAEVSPLREYLQRFKQRDDRYRETSTEQLILPEGYRKGLEEFVLTPATWKIPYELTLLPKHLEHWTDFWSKRLFWQPRHLELRDDILSAEQLQTAIETLPAEKVIYSRRTTKAPRPKGLAVDWPLELGPAGEKPFIFSLHEKSNSLEQSLSKLNGDTLLKAALPVDDFTELKAGHEWWLKDPSRRAFLPRSPKGRWRWYRSLYGRRMPLHYFREDEGTALDQPLLWQEVLQPDLKHGFGAVLGSPVEHSRSPLEHLEYFKSLDMPFVAIDVREDEFLTALPILIGLGLRAAAVTAPLKRLAFEAASAVSGEAKLTGAANTLLIHGARVSAHNTDVLALMKIKQAMAPDLNNIWLWGGGGVKTSVKAVWPGLHEVSARKGAGASPLPAGPPDVVIWATGRSREYQWPRVRPKLVLDLNYSEDSPGLEWAVRENLEYKSGLEMFSLQAAFQREFWKKGGLQ